MSDPQAIVDSLQIVIYINAAILLLNVVFSMYITARFRVLKEYSQFLIAETKQAEERIKTVYGLIDSIDNALKVFDKAQHNAILRLLGIVKDDKRKGANVD